MLGGHHCPSSVTGGREAPPTSKLPRLPRFDSCKLNPAWGLPAQKGQERRVKEDLETRPPAERLKETVTDFVFLGSKIIADGDCRHEI